MEDNQPDGEPVSAVPEGDEGVSASQELETLQDAGEANPESENVGSQTEEAGSPSGKAAEPPLEEAAAETAGPSSIREAEGEGEAEADSEGPAAIVPPAEPEPESQADADTEATAAQTEAEAVEGAAEPVEVEAEVPAEGEAEAAGPPPRESGGAGGAAAGADSARASSGQEASGPGEQQVQGGVHVSKDRAKVLFVLCFLGSRDRQRMVELDVHSPTSLLLESVSPDMGGADPSSLVGIYKGQKLEPGRSLASYGLANGDGIEVDVLQGLGDDVLIFKGKPQDAPESDVRVIEVEVEVEGAVRVIQVTIDASQMERKKYLGGFRNKRSGLTFHHASAQTTRLPKWTEADRKLTRETQTVKVKLHSMQAARDAATQMARPDLVVEEGGDKGVEARGYVTADEVWRVKEEMTVVIQRYTRGWFARRLASRLRAERRAQEEEDRAAQEAASRAEEERTLREIQRRMHPKNQSDFALLRHEVEKWRLAETRKIKSLDLPPEESHLALEELLYKQTRLLQTIDRLRVQAQEEIRSDKIGRVLTDMSAPKKWSVADGSTVEVHTPFTTRARELMHLYKGLTVAAPSVEARLNVLLHVKYTVKEFDCSLTRELVELVDREADLLNRGRPLATMEGLRRRIANLFLAFMETPEFNPEAGRYTVIPPTKLEMVRSALSMTKRSTHAPPAAPMKSAKAVRSSLMQAVTMGRGQADELLGGEGA